jgi:hypothetical protein
LTWYSPEEIAAILVDSGFRDVTTGASPRNDGDDTTFSVSARA